MGGSRLDSDVVVEARAGPKAADWSPARRVAAAAADRSPAADTGPAVVVGPPTASACFPTAPSTPPLAISPVAPNRGKGNLPHQHSVGYDKSTQPSHRR